MLSIIIAVVIAVWFWRSAGRVGRSRPGWAGLGFAAFLLAQVPVALVWMAVRSDVLRQVIRSDASPATMGIAIGLTVAVLAVGSGLLAAWWLHRATFGELPAASYAAVAPAHGPEQFAVHGIIQCDRCGSRVLPTESGECPSCRAAVAPERAPTPTPPAASSPPSS